MWKCSHCGQKNEDMALNCVQCGERRAVRGGIAAMKKPVPVWLYGILAVSLLASASLFAMYFINPAWGKTGQAVVESPEVSKQPEEQFVTEEQSPETTTVPTAIPQEIAAPSGGGELGTFSLTALDGRTVDDTLFSQNKLTMVNFWATWCGPCVGEIPDLQRIAEDYADSGFGIVGVLVSDPDTQGALEFLQSNGITYPVILPEGPFAALTEEFDAIPTTMFFDSDGNRVGETQTGSMDYDSWASLVDSLLAEVG